MIPKIQIDSFRDLLIDIDYIGFNGITEHSHSVDFKWVVCWPSDEFKVIAKLKFQITEIPAFGTEVDFSD